MGLTGGSASGKSSVARRMEGLGWGRVDCDALGHQVILELEGDRINERYDSRGTSAIQAYTPGAPAYEAIVAEWGQGVVAEDGTINRWTVALYRV